MQVRIVLFVMVAGAALATGGAAQVTCQTAACLTQQQNVPPGALDQHRSSAPVAPWQPGFITDQRATQQRLQSNSDLRTRQLLNSVDQGLSRGTVPRY